MTNHSTDVWTEIPEEIMSIITQNYWANGGDMVFTKYMLERYNMFIRRVRSRVGLLDTWETDMTPDELVMFRLTISRDE